MPRKLESLREMETHINFNETDEPALLWTASPKVRREWESYGFPVAPYGGGWRVEVPKSRISYKPLQKA